MKRIFLSIVLLFLFQNGWSQCPALANSTLGFETQADIAAFKADYPNCTEIPGNLRIVGNNVTDLSDLSQITSIGGTLIVNSTGITNLTGLGNITSVESGLQILGNQSMTSLTGLGNISDFWLRLSTNNALTSLTGLEHFTTVNTISVSENTSLASLSGLENITTITGLLDIALNTPVSTLAGLENLTYVNEIWLQHLHSLTDISAFANLTAISGRFYMYNCSLIANLDALSNVEQIGELVLFGNSSLTSLKGNSQELNRYTFTDEYPVPSVNYYRLRSVDLHESYSLSSMVSVTIAELLNLRGEIMKTWEIASDRDYLDLGSLPAGSYLIRLGSGAPLRLIKD